MKRLLAPSLSEPDLRHGGERVRARRRRNPEHLGRGQRLVLGLLIVAAQQLNARQVVA